MIVDRKKREKKGFYVEYIFCTNSIEFNYVTTTDCCRQSVQWFDVSAYSRLRLPGAQPFITKQHQKVPGLTLEGISCPSNSHRARENILPASGTSIM